MSNGNSAPGFGTRTKELLIALPVLGSALAVTYDVGFFWGLDINLFSTFSLTEHITFTLEYIPFALGLSTIAIILPFAIRRGRKESQKSAAHQLKTGKQIPFYKVGSNWFLLGCFFWNAFWIWKTGSAVSIVVLGFLVLATIMMSFDFSLAHMFALFFSTIIFAFAIAFALGLDFAKDFRRRGDYHQTIIPLQGAPITAKIVRSGDKGLLFLDKSTNALVLLPWNQIKEISSAQ